MYSQVNLDSIGSFFVSMQLCTCTFFVVEVCSNLVEIFFENGLWIRALQTVTHVSMPQSDFMSPHVIVI
jgi:hypothetical protein